MVRYSEFGEQSEPMRIAGVLLRASEFVYF